MSFRDTRENVRPLIIMSGWCAAISRPRTGESANRGSSWNSAADDHHVTGTMPDMTMRWIAISCARRPVVAVASSTT
ncbi:hypothetical protein AB0M83_06930 [Amycolatopsis sp. NPDC051106]|uniref:hypothetical protein n=1 Tax=unclassified Amycolatopsis TaxID=2618356 RepID=UPI00341DB6D4